MARGYSFIDLMAATAIATIMFGAAVPLAHSTIDRSRVSAAAAYMSSRVALTRAEAVKRSAFVAIQFVSRNDGYWFRSYLDGNHNGVLVRDIGRGIDSPITPELRLDQHFPGVSFGIHPEAGNIDPGEALNHGDPVQIGSSTLLSFNPNGSATSGTLFIRGQNATQMAVRVLGTTARTRVLRFDFQDGVWRTP
ncbi:MAG: GspH/FimT family pseudopilin [Vicinamibacterales bacterium]|nr:GspH/FimT family pseudopilin [Vicinamibacterales bacterium]